MLASGRPAAPRPPPLSGESARTNLSPTLGGGGGRAIVTLVTSQSIGRRRRRKAYESGKSEEEKLGLLLGRRACLDLRARDWRARVTCTFRRANHLRALVTFEPVSLLLFFPNFSPKFKSNPAFSPQPPHSFNAPASGEKAPFGRHFRPARRLLAELCLALGRPAGCSS